MYCVLNIWLNDLVDYSKKIINKAFNIMIRDKIYVIIDQILELV